VGPLIIQATATIFQQIMPRRQPPGRGHVQGGQFLVADCACPGPASQFSFDAARMVLLRNWPWNSVITVPSCHVTVMS